MYQIKTLNILSNENPIIRKINQLNSSQLPLNNQYQHKQNIKKICYKFNLSIYSTSSGKMSSSIDSKKIKKKTSKVGFQGQPGAYSQLACNEFFPEMEAYPCEFFEDAFHALATERVDFALLPVENSCGGTIHDVYLLLPKYGLHIIGEYSLKVNHCLMAPEGTNIKDIHTAMSHKQALAQCKQYLKKMNIKAKEYSDTAGSAALLSKEHVPGVAAIASSKAAEIYNMTILDANIQDISDNFTRFVALSPDNIKPSSIKEIKGEDYKTSIIFSCRDGAGGLLSLLSTFHNLGIVMEKIEPQPNPDFPLVDSKSGIEFGRSFNYLFVVDFVGNVEEDRFQKALIELEENTDFFRILGSYQKHKF